MESGRGFAASIINARKNIFFVQAEQPAGKAWYYVRVRPNKLPFFTRLLGKEPFDIPEFGDILCSGWGEAPPDSMRRLLEGLFTEA